jgi:hypothetical protein
MPFRIAAHPLPGLGDLVAEQLDALAANRASQTNIRLAELTSLDASRRDAARYQDAMNRLQQQRLDMDQRRLGQPDWQLFSQDGGIFAVDRQSPQSYRTVRAPDARAGGRNWQKLGVDSRGQTVMFDPATQEMQTMVGVFAQQPPNADPLATAVAEFELDAKLADQLAQQAPVDPMTGKRQQTPELMDAQQRVLGSRQRIEQLRAQSAARPYAPLGTRLDAAGARPQPMPTLQGAPRAATDALALGQIAANPYAALGALSDNSPRIWTGGVNNNGALNQPVASAPSVALTSATADSPALTELKAAARAGNLKAQTYLRGKQLSW